jgi:phosphoribosylamine--glycine ligase
MKVLLIGSGGREHALAIAISKSKLLSELFSLPGNPGINQIATKVPIELSNFDAIAQFCLDMNVSLVVIGPEQPLADGLSDYLRQRNINVFGPSRYCSQLESSKAFAKDFMTKYNIPTAAYKTFSAAQTVDVLEHLKSSSFPVVIKADGLAAGKGVAICNDFESAKSTVDSYFSGLFNEAGKTIVIEEFMEGEEASILAISDGTNFITLAPAQDHKRAFDGDEGPNTGGMGAYAPAPVVTDSILNDVREKIIQPVIDSLRNEGYPFIGCLYAGLMIKNDSSRVVEFNVRFGDPETQAVLPLFNGDFLNLLHSAAIGKLDDSEVINTVNGAACCVVLASQGYPGKFDKGFVISGLDYPKTDDLLVYQAGTKQLDDQIITDGGRVLGICGKGATLGDAIKTAYQGVDLVDFENKFYRKDIAHKAINR